MLLLSKIISRQTFGMHDMDFFKVDIDWQYLPVLNTDKIIINTKPFFKGVYRS